MKYWQRLQFVPKTHMDFIGTYDYFCSLSGAMSKPKKLEKGSSMVHMATKLRCVSTHKIRFQKKRVLLILKDPDVE